MQLRDICVHLEVLYSIGRAPVVESLACKRPVMGGGAAQQQGRHGRPSDLHWLSLPPIAAALGLHAPRSRAAPAGGRPTPFACGSG